MAGPLALAFLVANHFNTFLLGLLAAACDGDFGFSAVCVATAFYILTAACVDDLGVSTICVASAFYILICGFCVLAGHAATFGPLALAVFDEMLSAFCHC